MKHQRRLRIYLAALVMLTAPALASGAPVTISWWHAHDGALGKWVYGVCEVFNKSQTQYKVVPTYKGSYFDTMNAGIAAFRANSPPHILQVFEVGTATMMAAKDIVKPVYEVMKESGLPFDPSAYLPAVAAYYTTADGRMISMPFNSSTPVFYYNVEMFQKAGLDPDRPPRTWPEVGEMAKKLLAAGVCRAGFSSAWSGWIHLENLGAWHNVPFGTKANGFGGLDARYVFNSPLYVKHIQQLADWQKDRIFVYGGRYDAGMAKFSSGEVAMFTGSSSGYADFERDCPFEFRTSMLPYWPEVKGAPQNTIIGGASLWVLRGHEPGEYKGVAAFFNFLSKPQIQAGWHQGTGYLPITAAAYDLTKKEGFYEKKLGSETPLKQLTLHQPTENSKGIRFGDHAKTREIMGNELEAIFSGQKTAQQGLDDAVKAGNELLQKFENANK